jgi:hypothetical protein
MELSLRPKIFPVTIVGLEHFEAKVIILNRKNSNWHFLNNQKGFFKLPSACWVKWVVPLSPSLFFFFFFL